MRHSLQTAFVTIRVPNSLISEARPREMDDIIDELILCLEAIRDRSRSKRMAVGPQSPRRPSRQRHDLSFFIGWTGNKGVITQKPY